MKVKGRRVKLSDFLPEYAKPKTTEEDKESSLKKAFMAMAAQSKQNG